MFVLFFEIVAACFLVSVLVSIFAGKFIAAGKSKITPRPDVRPTMRLLRDD